MIEQPWGAVAALAAVAAFVLLPAAPLADPTEDAADSRVDPDYAAGKRAIEAKDWDAAIKALASAALRDARNADIRSYLGYAYRNAGKLDLAFKHYACALELNPRHRGAHEYLGEAYLVANNLPKAEEHLAALRRICLIPCEEYEDLAKQIETYRARKWIGCRPLDAPRGGATIAVASVCFNELVKVPARSTAAAPSNCRR